MATFSNSSAPPPRPTGHPLDFTTALIGSLNGQSVDFRGRGIIDEQRGLTAGTFSLRAVPDRLDPRSFGAFLFTGYPNSCRTSHADAGNPFSGGDYSYEREYSFAGSKERALLQVSCAVSFDGRHLDSLFEVSGSLPISGDIASVTPIYELWSPMGELIHGVFSVAWILERSEEIADVAIAESRYMPVQADALAGRAKHRFIELASHVQSGDLHVTQHSHLVGGAEGA